MENSAQEIDIDMFSYAIAARHAKRNPHRHAAAHKTLTMKKARISTTISSLKHLTLRVLGFKTQYIFGSTWQMGLRGQSIEIFAEDFLHRLRQCAARTPCIVQRDGGNR
jgi:hypothetical protein